MNIIKKLFFSVLLLSFSFIILFYSFQFIHKSFQTRFELRLPSSGKINDFIQKNFFEKKICVNLSNGLGDRFFLFNLYGLICKIYNCTLSISWFNSEKRTYDLYSFENYVDTEIKFVINESCLVIGDREVLNIHEMVKLNLFFKTKKLDLFDLISYKELLKKFQGLRFKIRDNNVKDSNYVLFHFRFDDTYQPTYEFKTKEIYDFLCVKQGIKCYFLSENKIISNQILNLTKEDNYILSENVYKLSNYIENSKAIIQHASRNWSSFTSFWAIKNNIPLLNTCKKRHFKYVQENHFYSYLNEEELFFKEINLEIQGKSENVF